MKSRAKAGSPELVYSNLIKFHVITTEPILMKCGHFGLMGYAYEEGCIGYISTFYGVFYGEIAKL